MFCCFFTNPISSQERPFFYLSLCSLIQDSRLFNVIGTQFGEGDGKTTFNIPNFCRRTLVGTGETATPILNNTVGSSGGEETHKMTMDELVAHAHSFSYYSSDPITHTNFPAFSNGKDLRNYQTGTTGNNQPFNIIQPSLVVNGLIKT